MIFFTQVQVKRYSTQVSLAKKEPRSLVQSRAIQTFLAKKEQEEKKKQLDDKRKKEVYTFDINKW